MPVATLPLKFIGEAHHLTKDEQVRLGSYYTPQELVEVVHDWIRPYANKKAIILDNAAGYGAFIDGLRHDWRAADFDRGAYDNLRRRFGDTGTYFGNSLDRVSRRMFDISETSRLIAVGNPPYNDTTSEFRNGRKGRNTCDPDLTDRDLGISFLRSYDKLGADVVCVLHPLSYLIKEANFRRLRRFAENYSLVRAVTFPSSLFPGTGQAKFPIIVGLYERRGGGMDYEHIRNFGFEVLGKKDKIFRLADYATTDGLINKYPPRSKDSPVSDIGTYFYTFRDLNSLRRNCGFMTEGHYNGIVVNVEDFHKYAYLYALKKWFEPEDLWLFGNLSPLVNGRRLEKKAPVFAGYALGDCSELKSLASRHRQKIARHYGLDKSVRPGLLEQQVLAEMRGLVRGGR